jgi:hypothetical protein
MAGGYDSGCSTCGLASGQALATGQGGPIASAQSPYIATGCDTCVDDNCGRKKCNLFGHLGGKLDGLHCKLKGMLHPPVTYEWVLKKKHLWGHKNNDCNTCGGGAVETVYPTSQVVPTGQGYPSGQGYTAPSGQGYSAPSGQGYSAPTYGAGQHAYQTSNSAPTIASVPAEMTSAFGAEEAPPAPEVKNSGGLLLPTPVGN